MNASQHGRVRGRVVGVLLTLTLLSGLLMVGPVAADPDDGVVAGSWIVVLEEGVLPAPAADALARAHRGEVGHVYEHVLGGFSFRGSARAAAALERNPLVDRVEPDRAVHALDQVPTGVSRVDAAHPEGYDVEGRTAAHDAEFRGAGTSIAVLDTGVDSTHPDLAVHADVGKNCTDDGGEFDTHDVHGHGTHVAGSATALDNGLGVVGVAPQATIIAVKVLGDDGSGSWASVLCGVDHVTGLVGSVPGPIVANMSLGGSAGGPDETALHDGIADSVAAGIVHVAAAGNSAADASDFVPAGYPEVITVSALADFDGRPGGEGGCQTFRGGGPPRTACDDEFAWFSNYGPAVDVIAPGVQITSTLTGGGHGSMSGTSMAAPHVAGVAALVLAENPDLDPEGVRAHLQTTGECPDGSWNAGGSVCDDQGQWPGDPDGIAEPLVNAYRAASTASDAEGFDPDDPEPDPDPDPDDPEPTGSVTGAVSDTGSGDPIAGATVSLTSAEGSHEAQTGNDGSYTIDDVVVGEYEASATADGYEPAENVTVTVEEDEEVRLDFVLEAVAPPEPDPDPDPEPEVMFLDLDGAAADANGRWFWRAEVTATVTAEGGAPVVGATVAGTWTGGNGTTSSTCTTGGDGTCTVTSERLDERRTDSVTFTVDDVSHPDYALEDDDHSVDVSGP